MTHFYCLQNTYIEARIAELYISSTTNTINPLEQV